MTGIDVFEAVPLLVGVSVIETVIGTQVDHTEPGVKQVGDRGHAGTVRQATEDRIGPLGNLAG